MSLRLINQKKLLTRWSPFLAGFFALAILTASSVSFISSSQVNARVQGWDASNIISDQVFTNSSSMSASSIQSFLNDRVPTCDTWGTQPSEFGGGTRRQWAESRGYSAPFTCLKDYSQNGKSAAQIIYDTAQKYQINPQVLLVLLQKEQSLVTDTWPVSIQYRSATGYGCPDTAPCDSQYYGLTNQLDWAAKMFRSIMNASPGWYTPYVVGNNFIRYSPDSSCGGSNVNIQNRATQALYNYTPYQPNEGALNADWGTANCGAYGNRNFYLYFQNWFGSPRLTVQGFIKDRYIQLAEEDGILGQPTNNEVRLRAGAWWQSFQNGFIIGTDKTKYWESLNGAIRNRWGALGYQDGSMGFITGAHITGGNGAKWQSYQHGYLIQAPSSTNAWESKGAIREYWKTTGYESGRLGYPVGPEVSGGNNTWWQSYNNGFIVGSGKTGFRESLNGAIRNRWGALGYQDGSMGYPTSNVITGGNGAKWQSYQHGYLIQAPSSTNAWESRGAIREYWANNGYENGDFGYPTGPEQYINGHWQQQYEGGLIKL